MIRTICCGLWFCLFMTCVVFGQEKRDFLIKSLEGKDLPQVKDIVYPGYTDRAFWDAIPVALKERTIRQAERSQEKGVWSIPLSAYLEYVRSGNRKDCDALDGAQRSQLQQLVLGELIEGKGRFIDAIADQVWMLCERSTWVGTAHLANQKKGAGVPDKNDVVIDLHSGEVSTLLAWTYYFFKDELDRISPLISQRLLSELNKRTFKPYLERDNFWWMGFKGEFVNNWNVWCNYNVLMSALLVNSTSKKEIVLKTMRSVDRFINYYKNDGGCEEGPSYWDHAPGKLMEYLEVLREVTDGKIDIFQQPLIQKMGRYIANVHIDSLNFINFADASARNSTLPTVIYRYGKNIHDPELMAFGKYMGDLTHVQKNPLRGSLDLILSNLLILEEYSQCIGKSPASRSVWMDGIEVAAGREKTGTTQGLFFAAKGGYNNESHNHNDVGSFVLYKNGKPVIVDAGVGTYTAKTFSNQRYEIWNMQSLWHNLPVINGQAQAFGSKYRSADVSFSDRGRKMIFSLDLAKAYPQNAACKNWKRTYTFSRGSDLRISDAFQLVEVKGENKLHFLTCCKVNLIKPGILLLGEGQEQVRMSYDPRQMEVTIEEKQLEDQRMVQVWGEKLVRIGLKYKNPGLQGKSEIVFK